MQQTLDLALDLNCEFANFYSAMAYPGSPLYEQALRLGWRLPDTWSGYSQHAVDTLPLPTNHLCRPARCCVSAIMRSTSISRTDRIWTWCAGSSATTPSRTFER